MTRRARSKPRRHGVAARLVLAIAMQREGLALMRENIRRAHPDASEREIDRLFEVWLLDRPADGPGEPIQWPRRRKKRAA
jgi:hypothetical protein